MAYKKKAPYRHKKTNYLKNTQTVANTAFTALKLAQGIARMVNTEVKVHDVSYSSSALSTSGQVLNICNPAQGDTMHQRDGISIKPLHLSIKGKFKTATAANFTQYARVIIFRGKQENGVTPAVTDVLETADVWSQKNYTDRFRTKVLSDRVIQLDTITTTSTTDKKYSLSKKLYGHVNFVEGAVTCENGGLYMLIIQEASSPIVQMTTRIRVSFTDN